VVSGVALRRCTPISALARSEKNSLGLAGGARRCYLEV
jgi:hypothetical protein